MKKQTKSTKSQKQQTRGATAITRAVVVHNRRQRFWGIVALAGLFFCGFMLGMDVQHKYPKPNTDNNIVNVDNAVPACEVVENILLMDVYPDGSIDFDDPEHNVNIYRKLLEVGCPENHEKYEQMMIRENEIVSALNRQPSQRNCETIEDILSRQLIDKNTPSFYSHMGNAKIYANLSERGCPENHSKYTELARQELEIARALEDDRLSNQDTIEVVETYKRIQMQKAAQEILDKAKKLTNPAIDFIIELEKIVNE